MNPTNDLVPVLKRLRLSGVLQSLDIRLRQAVDGEIGHTEFLYRLLADEVERRDARQLAQRLRKAAFSSDKSLDDFDWAFNPQLPKAKLLELATCHFIDAQSNVLLIGPAGVGKSHLAQSIGHRACRAGFTCQYLSAHKMLTLLRAGRADGTYERRLAKLTSVQLLIIDDVGLRPLEYDEPMDLYEIIRQRYERCSTILTSNRDVEEWYPLFGDPLMASAAMDRLLHHCEVITMNGRSYRTRKS